MNPASNFQTVFQAFNELTPAKLYQILQARSQVFVVEQQCPYQDIDGLDEACWHGQISNTQGTLMAYCRIIPPRTNSQNEVSLPAIGRVLVMTEYRGAGLARQLMLAAIGFCHDKYPQQSIIISAQTYLSGFYTSLGFRQIDEPYVEDGIEHVDMVYKQVKSAF